METTVTIGGVNCSNYIVFVNRHHSICGVVGEAEVGLDPTWNQAFSPYDEVVITESSDGGGPTTNLITNPSIETNTTGWYGIKTTISRDATYSVFGDYALKVITDNNLAWEGFASWVTDETAVNTEYTFSIYLRGSGTVRLRFWDGGAGNQYSSVITLTNDWARHELTATFGAGAIRQVSISTDVQQDITFYCDGFQLEQLAYATLYCDGTQSGCAWNGAPHASTSTRAVGDGIKVFTGYVANIGHSRMPPARVINCQCPLKLVRDYWLTEFSTGGSQVPTLIDNLMTTVGVSYSINDSYIYPTAEEEWMNTSAMDVLKSLLTMAGWQAYSDADGVIQIGLLTAGLVADHTFNEGDNLISVESARDDSWIRNAIAVYGAPGVSVKRYADDYGVGDFERAGAFANPLVGTTAAARRIADRALDLFDSELHVVHTEVLGDPDVWIGQMASVTDTFTGLDAHLDMITTVRASMSTDGYMLDVMMGERCPTIWGFGAPPVAAQYLYAATGGSGVYRSEDYGLTFAAVNGSGGSTLTGDALYVNAIEVDSSDNLTVWAATRGGIYRTQNGGQTSWIHMYPGRLYRLNTYDYSTDPIYYDVDQDELHPELVFFMAVDHTMQNSWVVKCTGGSAWDYWPVRWYE